MKCFEVLVLTDMPMHNHWSAWLQRAALIFLVVRRNIFACPSTSILCVSSMHEALLSFMDTEFCLVILDACISAEDDHKLLKSYKDTPHGLSGETRTRGILVPKQTDGKPIQNVVNFGVINLSNGKI